MLLHRLFSNGAGPQSPGPPLVALGGLGRVVMINSSFACDHPSGLFAILSPRAPCAVGVQLRGLLESSIHFPSSVFLIKRRG